MLVKAFMVGEKQTIEKYGLAKKQYHPIFNIEKDEVLTCNENREPVKVPLSAIDIITHIPEQQLFKNYYGGKS